MKHSVHSYLKTVALFLLLFAGKTQAQNITTFAGNGGSGFSGDGGNATSAQINGPGGVGVDAQGNVYIADGGNARIREVNTSGTITTVAGNGSGGYSGDGGAATSAQIYQPSAVVADANGNIYIADAGNDVVREVNTSGIITTVAGNGSTGYSGDGGAATSAELHGVYGVAVDASGNIYIPDFYNNRIRKVNTSGIITTVAGTGTAGYSGDGGSATSAEIWNPVSIAVDASGNIYFADRSNNVVRKVNTSGIISTVAGNGSAGYSGDGGSATSAQIWGPQGLTVDAYGNIYIGDNSNNRIRMVNTYGIISTVAGNGAAGYSGDGGSATSAELRSPTGVAVNARGNLLYIADNNNNRVREVTYPTTETWTGTTSTDWNDASNWSGGIVPTSITDVVIPSSPSNQPFLSADAIVSKLEVEGFLNLNGYSLTLDNALSGSGVMSSANITNTSTLNLTSSSNSIGTLQVETDFTLSGPLSVTKALEADGGFFNTGNQLTLASNSNGTAVVERVNIIINGNVTVQRYIPQGNKAFRDLGVAVAGGPTIAQAFNGGTTYKYTNGTWSSPLAASTSLSPMQGYRTLVDASSSDVTLSYTGTLLTGNQSPTLTGGQDKFSFIANPYQSQVDFDAITKSGLYNGYWYFNPKTFYNGYLEYNYYGTDLGSSNIYSGNPASEYLQPGQAFFVCSNTSGTPSLTFTESSKNNSNAQLSIFGTTTPLNRIATGLFTAGKNIDGAVVVFNSKFSNTVGQEDGLKINNHGENLTFNVSGKDLCANGWSLPKATDELPLHLYNLNTNTAYTLRLDASQFSGNGLSAYIKDNVLGTQTLLAGDSNIVAFTTTTDTAAYSNRYSIVFGASALPVKSISLTATELANKQVAVKWTTVGESNVSNYKVERSTDGITFTDLATVSPATSSNYSYIDATASEGMNYYRIKATDNAGVVAYSKVVSASLTINDSRLTIYPNPVKGNSFKLGLATTGKYTVSLVDKLGQTVYTTTVNHTAAATMESIALNKKLAAGSYTVKAIDESGKVSTTQIIIK